MQEPTKVSIIIPAYNVSEVISATVDSALNQTYSSIEIIIINDGSDDETGKAVEKYLNIPIVKYHYQENMGCSAAKNTGLNLSSGSYIQYLDADDLLSPDKIEKQMNAIANKKNAIAVCKTKLFFNDPIKDNGAEIDTEFLYSTDDTLSFMLNLYGINGKEGMIQPNAFLISRQLADKIGPWNTSISPSPDEDGEYFCRAMAATDRIVFTEGLNYYRKNSQKSSLSKGRSFEFAKGALRSIELKAATVFSIKDTPAIRFIFAKQIAGCIYQYGNQHPQIVHLGKILINNLGIEKIPVSGGRNFQMLAKLVGFENALKCKIALKL